MLKQIYALRKIFYLGKKKSREKFDGSHSSVRSRIHTFGGKQIFAFVAFIDTLMPSFLSNLYKMDTTSAAETHTESTPETSCELETDEVPFFTEVKDDNIATYVDSLLELGEWSDLTPAVQRKMTNPYICSLVR